MSDPTYHKGPRNYGTGFDMMDRIEELEAACWRMQEERDRAIAWRDSDKDRADKAEAKLVKAVEALGIIATYRKKCHDYDDDVGHDLRAFEEEDVERLEVIARTALAELKGTDK